MVVLRLHQVLHHGGKQGEPPASTSSCLVFPENSLTELSLRIAAVREERKTEKQRFKSVPTLHSLSPPSVCVCVCAGSSTSST